MKRTYVTPRTEKMEFNYSETVVASDTCGNKTTYSKHKTDGEHCQLVTEEYYVSN